MRYDFDHSLINGFSGENGADVAPARNRNILFSYSRNSYFTLIKMEALNRIILNEIRGRGRGFNAFSSVFNFRHE